MLLAVIERAHQLSTVPFRVGEICRSMRRQRLLVRRRRSWTLNSKHLTGDAVDVIALPNGEPSWDLKYYRQIATAFKAAAAELQIEIEWGGDWREVDGPHFELVLD